jgi:hypothetical protein
MRKSVIVAAIILSCGLLYAGAESYVRDGEPGLQAVEDALESLSKGEQGGFELLVKQIPNANSNPKWIDSQASLIRGHIESLGEPCGFELAEAQEVGRSLRCYTYLCKYEHGRIRWRFRFYRPRDEWVFEGYHFDSNDDALFSEAGHRLSIPDNSESVAERRQEHRK